MLRADGIGESDCEAIEPGLLAQPVNALTGLGYVAAGAVVLARLKLQQRRGTGGLSALLFAPIGIVASISHGPQTPGAKFQHDAPIAVPATGP